MTNAINIRASSIAGIIDCPKRGLSLALGLVKQLPSTPPAVIGSACHAATAVFDKHTLEGDPIKPDDAADVLIKEIEEPDYEVDWGSMDIRHAKMRALGVYTQYCATIAEKMNYTAVELPLEAITVDVDGIDIELTGTLDRIYTDFKPVDEHTDRISHGVLDIKTGARVCSTKPGKHKAQLAVYELLAERTLGEDINLPGLIGQLQTSTDYKVDIKPVSGAREALLGTDKHMGLLQHIGHMLKTGDFYGNSSSWLCSPKYCPLYDGCIFK